MSIHPTAIVHSNAIIHESAIIGPFCIIEDGVEVGEGSILHSNVVLHSGTWIGKNNQIFHGVTMGGLPQDLSFDPKKNTKTIVGDGNLIREGVIIHRATKEDGATRIGDGNYLMGNSHIGHDSRIGNYVILVQGSVLAGHVAIEDRVFISGLVAVHQFCRVGQNSIIGGCSKIIKDVPPFVTIDGHPGKVIGINSIGLRRSGYNLEVRNAIKKAYKTIYHSDLNLKEALEKLKEENSQILEIQKIVNFFESSKRGVSAHRKIGNGKSENLEVE